MTTTVEEEATTTNSSETPAEEPFADAVRRVVRPLDIVALLFPAALFLGVGILPAILREQLAFSYTDPDVLTALTAHFVHADSAHLFRNLTAYLIIVPTAYLTSVLAGRRRLFYTVFVVVFAVFPFVLSGLNLVVPREALSLGASGLTLAFVGYLPVAIAEYVRSQFGVVSVVRRNIAAGLFFVGLIIVIPLAAATVQPRLTIVLVSVVLLAIIGYGVALQRSGIDRSTLRGPPPGFLELGVWSIAILVAVLIAAFPTDPLSDAGLVNTYTHFLGYSLGFLSSYLVVLLSFDIE
jgi:membrane associated rhomboid family serine protease